jgi:hypothetical protein
MALTKLNYTGQGTIPIASIPTITGAKMPAGSIIHTVSNTFTGLATFTNGTVDLGLSCAIIPKESNSLLMITASLLYSVNSNGTFAFITDSSNNMIQQPPAFGSRSRSHFGTHYGSSAFLTYNTMRSSHTVFTTHTGTSSQTFKVRVTADANSTFCVNRNVYNNDRLSDPVGICTMIIQEIKQ